MDRYNDIQAFYYGSWARDIDEPHDWCDLDMKTQTEIDEAYSKYKKEFVEWEEWYYSPGSYYGVSR